MIARQYHRLMVPLNGWVGFEIWPINQVEQRQVGRVGGGVCGDVVTECDGWAVWAKWVGNDMGEKNSKIMGLQMVEQEIILVMLNFTHSSHW